MNIKGGGLEIASMADIPAGTGLGSSGSFTTALLRALHTYQAHSISPYALAEEACHIELDRLQEPIGKQDQFIASFVGINCFWFNTDDTVTIAPLSISSTTRYDLEDNLILFFTGYTRSASGILKEQDSKTKSDDSEMIENLHYVKELGFRSKDALEQGDLESFGAIMHEHWEFKKQRSSAMTNSKIDHWYKLAMQNGAIGGKLIGAGGGGFLLFLTPEKTRLRRTMIREGLQEVRFNFNFEGSKILAS